MVKRRMWTLVVTAGAAILLVSTACSADAPGPTPSSTAPGITIPPSLGTGWPGRTDCASRPSDCGWPDETNTGVPAGTALTVHEGDLEIETAGAVVEGLDIRGCVLVKAPNVTIRRSKVTCDFAYAIGSFPDGHDVSGLLVEDVEVDCLSRPATGIGYSEFVARRVNIHHCENGLDIDDDVTVENSYIHDLSETGDGHADGIQLAGGANIVIRHNTIVVFGGTSAIISGSTTNVTVEANLLGGGAYTLYCPDESTDYRVINNRFIKRDEFGPWTECDRVAENRDNVWDSTLTPVPLTD